MPFEPSQSDAPVLTKMAHSVATLAKSALASTFSAAAAREAIREIDAGTIHINWTPLWRADLMPYGGLKGSGIGKEGPRSAVAEMTDVKTVILHGRPW